MTTTPFTDRLATLRAELASIRAKGASGRQDHESALGTLAGVDAVLAEIDRSGDGQAFDEQILHDSPTIIWRGVVGSHLMTYVSPNIERVTQYPAALFREQPEFWISHVHPEDLPAIALMCERAMARQVPSVVYEYRFRRRDGAYRWFYEQQRFIYDRAGVAVEYVGYTTDITERKQSELALQEREGRLAYHASIIDRVNDAIIEVDPELRIIQWNQAAERIYGWRADEVLGRPLADFIPVIRYLNGQTRSDVFAEMDRHGVWSGEVVQLHRDGRELILDGSARVIRDEQGAILSRVSINRDITERRRSEEALARSAERLRRLRAIDEAILAVQPAETIARNVLEHIRELVPCMRATIALLDECTEEIVVLAVEPEDARWPDMGSRMPVADGQIRAQLEAGQSCLVNDLASPEAASGALRILRSAGVRSYLITPLLSADGLIGSLNLAAADPGAFSPEHLEIAGELAATLAVALQNARLYAAERRANEISEILRAAGLALTQSLELPTVLDTLLGQLKRLVPYDTANVMLLDDDGQLTLLAGRGYEHWNNGAWLPLHPFDPQQTESFQTILRTRRSLLIPDTHAYAGWQRRPAGAHVRNFLGVPLIVADTIIGVVCLDKAQPCFFTDEHVRLAEMLAVDAAIAIQHGRLFEQVREGRERLERLSQQLIQVQELERRQIARELHDEIGQALTALKINMQALQRSVDPHAIVRRVDESIAITEQTIRQVRDLSLELRPSLLDDLGLGSALRWYVTRLAERTGIAGTVAVDDDERRYTPEIETTGFRMAQEALTNVVRHARARHIWVGVWHTSSALELVIRDDGVGFDVAAARERAARGQSLGLMGMQERVLLIGGELEITSAPGHGAEVRARLPLDPVHQTLQLRGMEWE